MLNEQKITYRMKTLMESGFFGNKPLLTEEFADKDKVRLFQAAYNYTYDKNLAVDGIKGAQTNAAIEDVKKLLGKDKLDNDGAKEFYQKFLTKLDDNKSNINVGQGGANTNKVLNYAIQTLINLEGTPLGIDGVIGTKTMAAIKTVADNSEVINSQNITNITGKAARSVLQLGVEGIATTQGGAAKTPQQIEAESREAWKKYPCITQAAGIIEDKNADGSIAYFDKSKANRYFANGRKMRMADSVKEDYYCNGMTVTIGAMSDNTKAEGKCESGNCVNGTGKLITAAGDTLIGAFANGKLTGADNEISFKAFSSYFKGETKDGKMIKGAYRLKDGALYDGFFLNGKFHGNSSLYMNALGKKWRGNFRNGAPVGTTLKELDAMANDEKETTFPTPAMQSGADDVKNKQLFNAELKKVIEVVKTYPANKQKGSYELYRGASFRVINYSNKVILSSVNIFSDLKNISSVGKWVYNPLANSISFNNGKYVYKA